MPDAVVDSRYIALKLIALKLIALLYEQGAINRATYECVCATYGAPPSSEH